MFKAETQPIVPSHGRTIVDHNTIDEEEDAILEIPDKNRDDSLSEKRRERRRAREESKASATDSSASETIE